MLLMEISAFLVVLSQVRPGIGQSRVQDSKQEGRAKVFHQKARHNHPFG
jgi:hypothetical protein